MLKNIILLTLIITLNFLYSQTPYKGPIIDTHCHVSLLDYNASMSGRNADIPTLNGIYADKKFEKVGLIVIAKKGEMEKTIAKNDSLIVFCQNNPKYYPICSVHPDDGEAAIKEVERIHKKGGRFLKFHTAAQNFDPTSDNARKVFQKASDLKMVMLFDGWNPSDANLIGNLISVAASMQDGKFIIAHAGGPLFCQTILLNIYSAQEWYMKNIWVDISAVPYIYEDSPYIEQFKWTIRKIGTDRVLFGSDYPFVPVEEAIKSVEKLGLTPEEMKAIMYDNARDLLN